MDLKNVQNQSMRLVLSTDTKPRMKWTPELHQRFIDAISQLGGVEKLTETRGFNLNCGERNKNRGTMCSMESSLTYCESSEGEENQILYHELEKVQKSNTATVEFPLLAIQVEDTRDGASEKKRSAETDSDGGCVDQPSEKRCCNKLRKSEMLEIIDLNS
ncbi:hypothetical protein TanjilG_13841 [Lupinus angustifolius]|uniref:Uncharacterized protein n=1 Tax=Lupinus angustifolius TaxID=3871 RepID=A0A394DG88_LUPAN|nr:hypothetical protein TanjilG_13841 [Lupinus angustifolius]